MSLACGYDRGSRSGMSEYANPPPGGFIVNLFCLKDVELILNNPIVVLMIRIATSLRK